MFMDQLEFPKNAWILGLFSHKTPFNFGSLFMTLTTSRLRTLCVVGLTQIHSCWTQLSNKTHIPLEPNSQLTYSQARLRWFVS